MSKKNPMMTPSLGDIVIVVNPMQDNPALKSAPAIVTFADDLVINAHIFLNTAPAVIGIAIPHLSIKGPIFAQPYWVYGSYFDALPSKKGGK